MIATSIVGLYGIPLGDPKFLPEALALEAAYVALAILAWKKIRRALLANIGIACAVIAGNTLSSTHTEIMLELNPLQNAIVLIAGGYVLQFLLIATSVLAYRKARHVITS